jgi:hypothetical protein
MTGRDYDVMVVIQPADETKSRAGKLANWQTGKGASARLPVCQSARDRRGEP